MINQNVTRLLLAIAKDFSAENSSAKWIAKSRDRVDENITRARKALAKLNLELEDVLIISLITSHVFHNHGDISTTSLLSEMSERKFDPVDILERIRRLVDRKVIEPGEKRYKRLGRNSNKVQLVIDRAYLLDCDLTLTQKFTRFILGEIPEICDERPESYQNNEEYLEDWFEYVLVRRDYGVSNNHRFPGDNECYAELYRVNQLRERLLTRTSLTDMKFPFQQVIEEYDLDEHEQIALIYLLHEGLGGSPCDIDDLVDVIADDRFGKFKYRRYFGKDSKLCRNGLVELGGRSMFRQKNENIAITPEVMIRITAAEAATDKEKLNRILNGDNILTLQKPEHDFDSLVLNRELINIINGGIAQFEGDRTKVLSEWGILKGTENGDSCNSLLMLFHGVPGTGKTFAAHSIASVLGKDLIVTDVSRILSCWVGESEQNLQRLFKKMDLINKDLQNPPVLLLNEADQFFTSRGSVENGVDRMYNQMQNILLEGLESFNGILIAATNLKCNFDTAFSRRFHIKIEFPFPEYEQRLRLWQIHLPAALPLAKDIDIKALADYYRLTGGQIALVVKNTAAMVAGRKGKYRRVFQADLIKYCELERDSSFDKAASNRIGFRTPVKNGI